MKFINPYATHQEKVSTLQRWLLVHSYLYYHVDSPAVSDHVFDENSKQLYELMIEHNSLTRYSYVFKDFDGSSGYDLFYRAGNKIKDRVLLDVDIILKRN